MPAIDKVWEGQGRIVSLSPKQCGGLIKAAVADSDIDLWLFVAIGLSTGMRHSEIIRVRWAEIDFSRLRIFVPLAKAGSREQPIPAETLQAERKQRNDQGGWVFPAQSKSSKSGHRRHLDQSSKRAVLAAGLDPKIVTSHVMRHTAVTRLVKSGADIPTIMKISGHKTVAMVLRYTHVDSAHIDAAAATLGMTIPGTTHREFTAPETALPAKVA